MTQPLIVEIPHRLGREEAKRRLTDGLGRAGSQFGGLMAVDRADWVGDRVSFSLRALGQAASGNIDVADDHLRLEVTLPWLLAKLSEKFIPQLRRETALLLEKK